jgi:hypothetical protein
MGIFNEGALSSLFSNLSAPRSLVLMCNFDFHSTNIPNFPISLLSVMEASIA